MLKSFEKEIYRYVAEKVLEDLEQVSSDLASAIYRPPIIDEVRRHVLPEDFPRIKTLAQNSTDIAVWAFLVGGLLRQIRNEPGVRDWLVEQWKTWPDFEHRYHLVFRLLDYEDLSPEQKNELWDYVRQNEDRFALEKVDWYGGTAGVNEGVRNRLDDPDFTPGKKWIYLVSLLATDDKQTALDILSKFQLGDELYSEVHKHVREKLSKH